MCVCKRKCACVCKRERVCICVREGMHFLVGVSAYERERGRECVYVCKRVCVYVRVCVYTRVCVCVRERELKNLIFQGL